MNAGHVQGVVDQVQELGGTVLLWALDEIHPDLASITVGSGPGGRFPNLNRMLSEAKLGVGHVLVFDDDVSIRHGGVAQLLGTMDACGLDLAQPAHGRRSNFTYDFTRRRPFTAARQTTFVEIGPLFAVAPQALSRFMPFPELGQMGYGTEALWHDHHVDGARLGIVDAVEMRHLGTVATSYGETVENERERANGMLRDRGFGSWTELQKCLERHRPWSLAGVA